MSRSLGTPRVATRVLAATLVTSLVAVVTLVGPGAERASAASYTAFDEASWRTAVNAALANTGEANTITITADFTMNDLIGTTPSYHDTSHDLVIDGGGHTVTAAPTNTSPFLDSWNNTGSITVSDITLTGFDTFTTLSLSADAGVDLHTVTVTNYSNAVAPAVGLASTMGVGIEDSTFANNSLGGALGITSLFTSVSDSVFTGNQTNNSGGAFYSTSPVAIINSTFTGNSAVGDGGAVYSGGPVWAVDDSRFSSNTASNNGGAVYSTNVGVVQGSTFEDNEATNYGGAFYVDLGNFSAYESTFRDNMADIGGAVYGDTYVESFTSTWVGNQADEGGAFFTNGTESFSSILDSTLVDNRGLVRGGAVYVGNNSLDLTSSVFTGNQSPLGAHLFVGVDDLATSGTVFSAGVGSPSCSVAGEVFSNGHNFDDDGSCTDSWASADDLGSPGANPLLGALADNGGPTLTRQPLPESPLIDAILWSACPVLVDQRGVVRVDTGADVDGCDIGSVEVIKDLVFDIVGASGTTHVTVSDALAYDCDAWTPIVGYLPAPPAGISFPHGVFEYCFTVPDDGWMVTVRLNLPSPVNTLWKETSGVWSEVPGAVFAGTTVTYRITDGGPLDDDGTEDAYIIDPVGPGLRAGFTG